MQLSLALFVVLVTSTSAASLRHNSTVPITEKVPIEDVQVYGQSSGTAQINTCAARRELSVAYDDSGISLIDMESLHRASSGPRVRRAGVH